jgi:hypothetical protein
VRDLYQPGHEIVLPSGARVVIYNVRADAVLCRYVSPRSGDNEVTLTKLFCDRHCYLVQKAMAA